MKRQPPFAGQRGHLAAGDAADMFDADMGVGLARQEALIVGIDHHPDGQVIDHRRGEGCLTGGAHDGSPGACDATDADR